MTAADNSPDRIAYLDYIRGISILLVVFCHFTVPYHGSVAAALIMSLAWGAVPCFFMVSGGLLHQKTEFVWKQYIRRLVQAYLVLCAWKVIYLLVTLLYAEVGFSKVELVTYLFLFGSIDGVSSNVMWFMYAYLLVLIFYPISWFLFRHFSEGRKILIFITGMLFVFGPVIHTLNFLFQMISNATGRNLLSFSSFANVSPFSTYQNSLFYFLLGALLFYYREQIGDFFREKIQRIWIPIACMALGIFGLMMIHRWQTGAFRWNGTYLSLNDGYLYISTILLAIGMYLLIQNYLGRIRVRWLAVFGRNTMGIYYLHYMLLAFLSSTTLWIVLENYPFIPVNLVKTAVVATACLFATMGLRRIPVVKRLVS